MTRNLKALFPLICSLLWAPMAPAVTIDCGPTLCYQYDETQAGISLMGNPVRVGDSMQFLPGAFGVQSANAAGLNSLAASFVFDRVYTVGGGDIQSLLTQLEGDYELAGGGGSLLARLRLEATSNLGSDTASHSSDFSSATPNGLPAIFNLDAALSPAAAFSGPASDLRLTISLLLETTTGNAGELAWVQGKFALAEGTVVPLPGSLWLLVTAAGICGSLARRRKTAT